MANNAKTTLDIIDLFLKELNVNEITQDVFNDRKEEIYKVFDTTVGYMIQDVFNLKDDVITNDLINEELAFKFLNGKVKWNKLVDYSIKNYESKK